MKIVISFLVLFAISNISYATDKYSMTGFYDFELGRVEFKSCTARFNKEDNLIFISAHAFDLTQDDINAYRSVYRIDNNIQRSMAMFKVEERHEIPKGRDKHPEAYVEVIFKKGQSVDIKNIQDVKISFSGGGETGITYTSYPSNLNLYDAKIDSVDRYSVSGKVTPKETKSSFKLDFTCPVLN